MRNSAADTVHGLLAWHTVELRSYVSPSGSITMNRFANNESRGTAVEYGLIVAAISVAILAVLNAVSAPLIQTVSSIPTELAASGANK
jgi:Flp pilus assembly pilin Flp